MSDDTVFPAWGFWADYRWNEFNRTNTRHLFLSKEKAACHFDPNTRRYERTLYRFHERPKVDGLLDVMSEMYRGRRIRDDDFPKCKRCLRYEEKMRQEKGDEV